MNRFFSRMERPHRLKTRPTFRTPRSFFGSSRVQEGIPRHDPQRCSRPIRRAALPIDCSLPPTHRLVRFVRLVPLVRQERDLGPPHAASSYREKRTPTSVIRQSKKSLIEEFFRNTRARSVQQRSRASVLTRTRNAEWDRDRVKGREASSHRANSHSAPVSFPPRASPRSRRGEQECARNGRRASRTAPAHADPAATP